MVGRLWGRVRYIAKSGLRRRLRDITLRAGPDDLFVVREDLARRYLAGSGIEIGPFAFPLRVPPGVRVRYVDRLDRDGLIRAHSDMCAEAGLDPASIPNVDVIDQAERLTTFADGSVDFVVANHVLEHIEDPIGALEQLLRVIRSHGILFLTLPDARRTFDAPRARTTVEHLLRDRREGPLVSRHQHYEEWARFNEGLDEGRIAERAAEFELDDARHHFHVWELEDFLAMLRAVVLPCRLELAQASQHEFAVILRKN